MIHSIMKLKLSRVTAPDAERDKLPSPLFDLDRPFIHSTNICRVPTMCQTLSLVLETFPSTKTPFSHEAFRLAGQTTQMSLNYIYFLHNQKFK